MYETSCYSLTYSILYCTSSIRYSQLQCNYTDRMPHAHPRFKFQSPVWYVLRSLKTMNCGKPTHCLFANSNQRSLFGWFVLCSVGASQRCYLGMSDPHLLLSWAGSGCCDTTPDIGQTQLRLSLLRRESRAAVLPPPLVLLDNNYQPGHVLE